MTNWKPIETAPTDRSVLVWVESTVEMFVAFPGEHIITGEKSWVFARFDNGDCALVNNPTHWMELPSPPCRDKNPGQILR